MRSTKLVIALLAVTALTAAACEKIEENDGDGDADADSDADIDADADSDADVDGDADGDADSDVDGDADGDEAEDGGAEAITARVVVDTSMGSFTIGLYGNAGPVTVANFLSYVDQEFFSGTIFHRVIADFMIQGGGFNEAMVRQPTDPPIELEIIPWLSHQPGVISMARTNQPNSATSQFFICVSDDSFLDGDYAAFGIVEDGYDVVEAISLVDTHTTGGMEDVPATAVVINSITRL